jgi:general secretion pathway protein I
MKHPPVKQGGYTLLEVLVATMIMAIAVTGLLSALSTSIGNAARLTVYDRAALLGRQKMDELLIADKLPKLTPFEGTWAPDIAGDLRAGWRARLSPFEMPPTAGPGTPYLERVELEIWWMNGEKRRTLSLDGFRRSVITPEDRAAGIGR